MAAIERALAAFAVETPSWGYGDGGTRFGVFPQPGRPRDVFEKIADAARVQRLTGAAPAVALHFPWDAVDDLDELSGSAGRRRPPCRAPSTPTSSRTPSTSLGSLTNPDGGIRRKAIHHLLECVQIATELGSTAQSLWLADGTNYAGQDDLRARRDRLQGGTGVRTTARCRPSRSCSSNTSSSSPPSTPPTSPTGARRCCCARRWASGRCVLVDLGHHAQGVNVEQIVAILGREDRLGGFHFNNRKYADDDLIVGSVNPLELFLIFAELGAGSGATPRASPSTSPTTSRPRWRRWCSAWSTSRSPTPSRCSSTAPRWRRRRGDGDVLRGHELLLDAFNTDVRPLCARVREELGAAADPYRGAA